MTIVINRIPYKMLRVSEYPLFIKQTIEIGGKYDVDALHLKKSFIRLKDCQPAVEKIRVQESKSEHSKSLQELDDERDAILRAIINQVANYNAITIANIKSNTEILNRFLDKHGRDMATDTYNAETKRIDDFIYDYENNATFKDAVEALNMTFLFDQLKLINFEFEKTFMLRTEESSTIEKVETIKIRTETDKALTIFYNGIEFLSTEYEDLDYTALANELNDLLMHYRTLLKARNTRRIHGKETDDTENIDGE